MGSEVRDFEAARTQAVDTLPEFARNCLSNGAEQRDLTAAIRDKDGNAPYRATLAFTGEHLADGA